MLTISLGCWLYFWYVEFDCISGILTIFLCSIFNSCDVFNNILLFYKLNMCSVSEMIQKFEVQLSNIQILRAMHGHGHREGQRGVGQPSMTKQIHSIAPFFILESRYFMNPQIPVFSRQCLHKWWIFHLFCVFIDFGHTVCRTPTKMWKILSNRIFLIPSLNLTSIYQVRC